MRKGVWFSVVFILSLFLMISPPIIFVLIIKTSLFSCCLRIEDKNILEACDVNEMGLEFNMVFMQNSNISFGYTYFLDIYPTLRDPQPVDVSVNWSSLVAPDSPNGVQVTMAPSEHRAIGIPSSLQMGFVEQSMKGVSIKASGKIGVYAMNVRESTCDGFLVLPNHLLGKNHFVVCFFPQDRKSQMAFVATEDNTTVVVVLRNKTRPSIRLSWLGKNFLNGDNVTFRLSRDEAVHIQTDGDLTGCGVHSDKPIAVFAGNDVTRVGEKLFASVDVNFSWAGNHLVEQIPDVRHWGREFYLVPFVFKFNSTANSPGYLIKVVCSERNTSIDFYFTSGNMSSFTCIETGDYFNTFVQKYEGLSIRSSSPVLVAQIFASSEDLSPSMLLVTPAEKFNSYYVIPTPKSHGNGSFYHFLQIAMPSNETEGLTMDSKPLDKTIEWNSFNDSSLFVWSSFELSEGIHTLSHQKNYRFGASIVGHSKMPRFCSYAYPAGLCS